MIISILEPLPTHVVTSPSTSLCSFCNSRLELLILANKHVSNTQGLLQALVSYTSITCISNMSLCHPSYPPSIWGSSTSVTISFAVEALSFRLRSSFSFLHWSDNLFAILLEVPFLSLSLLLETSGVVNHQHLMLFLDLYLHRFQHHEELGNRFRHPLHTIVHHEVLVIW